MATHSSILTWRIPWTLVGYSPWVAKESHSLATRHQHQLLFLTQHSRPFYYYHQLAWAMLVQ